MNTVGEHVYGTKYMDRQPHKACQLPGTNLCSSWLHQHINTQHLVVKPVLFVK